MLDDLGLWLLCSPMQGDLTVCAITTLLVLPGISGMFIILIICLIGVPILAFLKIKNLIERATKKRG